MPERRAVAALLEETTRAWVADPESDVVWAGPYEGRWGIRIAQRARDFTTIWFDVGERTVMVEAYLLPEPMGDPAGAFRQCLVRNRSALRVWFALDVDGGIILRGRLPLATVDAGVLDAVVGEVYDLVEVAFPPLLRTLREKTP